MHPALPRIFQHDIVQHPDGFWMALGANVRPIDPAELKYHFAYNYFVGDEDITQPVSLSHFNGSDIRDPVDDQGPLGDCATKSAEQAAVTSAIGVGWDRSRLPKLHNGYGYELVRKVENGANWQADSGSALGDNADLLLKPTTIQLADTPFVPDASYDYGDRSQQAASENNVWLKSHNPIWPDNTTNLLKAVHAALRMGFCVQFGSYWPQKWFSPDASGILPDATVNDPMAGGHAYRCWGMINGYFLLRNQWTAGWNTQVTRFGNDCQPGDMVMSWNMAMGAQPMVFETRVYVPLPVVQPDPQPQPTRDSTPYWSWLVREGRVVLQTPDEGIRAQQAQIVYTTTKSWFPEVK